MTKDNEKDITTSELRQVDTAATMASGKEDYSVTYTNEEERSLIKKLDWWIVPLMFITNGLDFLDKATFQAAALFGMVEDLGLVTVTGYTESGEPITDNTKYSIATMMFFIGCIVGAYPWGIIAQKLPTGKVAATACILWSVIGLTTASCKGYSGILANRFFLGVCASAIQPIFTVYVTYWWTREEQVLRSAYWYAASGVASVIGPVLGWGTSKIQGPLAPWKYMYYIITAVSLGWGILLLIFLPDEPASARWLTAREKEIAIERMRRNQAGSTERKFKWKQVKEGLLSHNFWFLILFQLVVNAPVASFTAFSTLVIKGLGFGSSESLLLTIPLGAVAASTSIISAVIARNFKGMRYHLMYSMLLVELVGCLMSWQSTNPGVRYAGLVLFPFAVGSSALGISLASSNIAGNTKKYLVSSMVYMAQQVGSIMGSLVFGSSTGPKFNSGFIGNIVFTIFCMVAAILSRFWLSRENKRRNAEFGEPTFEDEDLNFEEDKTDKENKANFRYIL